MIAKALFKEKRTSNVNRQEINSVNTKKQMTKFTTTNFKKKFKSMLYHIENSKTRGQTV